MSASAIERALPAQDAAEHIAREARQWLLAQGLLGALGWAPLAAGQPASMARALGSAGSGAAAHITMRVAHTPLGQPYLMDASGDQLPGWGLSFAHDGGLHVCAAAQGSALAGLGVDLVHVPRLQRNGKDARYLLRLARRILPAEALASLGGEVECSDLESLRERVAAHFALMEAASKALGTGLRMGAGLGQAFGLPPRSVGAVSVSPSVRMFASGEAAARLAALGGGRLAGQWWRRGELLVGLAVALKAESGDGPAGRA